MKKKNIVVFSLILFFLLFLYTNVSALTVCGYQWGDKNILIVYGPDGKLSRIMTSGYKVSKDNTIVLQEDGTCPWISFDTNKKIYSSQTKCLEANNNSSYVCGWEISGEPTIIDDVDDLEHQADINNSQQAVLVSKSASECVYKSIVDEKYTFDFYVRASKGSGYRPDLSCDSSKSSKCTLDSNAAYFYGANQSTGTNFICPRYVYYTYGFTANPSRTAIKIVGAGSAEDSNSSGVNSDIEGDVKGTIEGADSPLTPSELNCDGIFQGRFGQFLMEIWKLIKFAVPILIIAFAIVDFIKAMSSHDDAEVKKAANKLVKRLVIGVLIFVLPTIIEYILSLAGIEFGTCGIK